MKNIDKLIINFHCEESQPCGKLVVKHNGHNTYFLIMMKEYKRKIDGLGRGSVGTG